jgi:hypothetical protein
MTDPRHVHSDATILAALRSGEKPRNVQRRLGCTWARVKALAIAHGLYPSRTSTLRRSYTNKGRRYVGNTRVPDDWHVVAVEYDGDKITMMKGEVNE